MAAFPESDTVSMLAIELSGAVSWSVDVIVRIHDPDYYVSESGCLTSLTSLEEMLDVLETGIANAREYADYGYGDSA